MYRLCSNVEDHSNVDTSNTLYEGPIMAAEEQLLIWIWKRGLLELEILCAILGLLCSLQKFQFLLLASHMRSMCPLLVMDPDLMRRAHTIDVLPLKTFWWWRNLVGLMNSWMSQKLQSTKAFIK